MYAGVSFQCQRFPGIVSSPVYTPDGDRVSTSQNMRVLNFRESIAEILALEFMMSLQPLTSQFFVGIKSGKI